MAPLNSRGAMTPAQSKAQQLNYLCLIQAAAKECWLAQADVDSPPHDNNTEQSLNQFQRYMSKLAQVLQAEKGSGPITALACLNNGLGGVEFIFASNARPLPQLEETKRFLEELLTYAATNPQELKPRALQKQVLWRIIKSSFNKIECYLQALRTSLDYCIHACRPLADNPESPVDSGIVGQLSELRRRATFPRDMNSSENARSKYLKDCETLIKAVQAFRNTPCESWLSRRTDGESALSEWRSLRHHLGRLHSFRQAAEVIADAPSTWPKLFESFTINYIPSASRKRIPLPKSSDLVEIFSVAYPESNISEFSAYLSGPQGADLQQKIQEQISKRSIRTSIHAEVHLHSWLVQNGRTKPSDFWDQCPFIATSKPPCQLCHYYFNSSGDDFQVQSPHMNLYPNCRFPDGVTLGVMSDMAEELQAGNRQILEDQSPWYKRNDSSTGSYGAMTAATPVSHRTYSHSSVSRHVGATSKMGRANIRPQSENTQYYLKTSVVREEDEYVDEVEILEEDDEDYEHEHAF